MRGGYYSLLTTHYSLLTTHYSLLTTHYSLLTTHPLAIRGALVVGEIDRQVLEVGHAVEVEDACVLAAEFVLLRRRRARADVASVEPALRANR